MRKKITVSIVEDTPEFRDTLVCALTTAGNMAVVHVATDLREGMALLKRPATDVLLVDLDLPDGEGYDIIRSATRVWPGCKIMVISVFGEGHKVVPALECGAEGYIVKSGGLTDIQHQVQALMKGECPVSQAIAKHIVRRVRVIGEATHPFMQSSEPNEKLLLLPKQEAETIRLIAKGLEVLEVAAYMGVQPSTIRTYLKRIRERLGAKNKVEALHALGLIDDSRVPTVPAYAPKPRKTG